MDEFEQVAVYPRAGDVAIMRGGQVRYTVRALPENVLRYGSDVVLTTRQVTCRQRVMATLENCPDRLPGCPVHVEGQTIPVSVTTEEPVSMGPSAWVDLVRSACSVIPANVFRGLPALEK